MAKLTITVDPDLCIGAASCVTIAPETFQLDAENKALVLDHGQETGGPTHQRVIEVTEDQQSTIIMAAQSCPTLAITITDESGKQLFPEM